MDPELATALRRTRYLYLTTYSDAGKPGTVPTWCWLHDDAVYFTTQRASLKARRIAKNGRVTVHVGREDGPAFEGRAELVEQFPLRFSCGFTVINQIQERFGGFGELCVLRFEGDEEPFEAGAEADAGGWAAAEIFDEVQRLLKDYRAGGGKQ